MRLAGLVWCGRLPGLMLFPCGTTMVRAWRNLKFVLTRGARTHAGVSSHFLKLIVVLDLSTPSMLDTFVQLPIAG